MIDLNLPAICLIFCVLHPPEPVVVNNYATECRVYDISKKDTALTQRNISRENARCRAAKAAKK